jgi:protease-4
MKWFSQIEPVVAGFLLLLPAYPAWAADEKPAPPVIAHLKLSGAMDEAPSPADPLMGGAGENLKSKLDRIRKAKNDPKVLALYLEIGDLGIGFGKLAELQRTLADFRSSGKKTYAYFEDAGAIEYLAAVGGDTIAMPESGTLMLTGLRASVTFYKDMLDLLRVKADVLKIGDYKGAVEPFTRNSLSKENQEQIESMLDDHFKHDLVAGIVAGRPAKKWNAEAVKKLIDEGPFTAKRATELGLVDRLAYTDAFEEFIRKDVKEDKAQIVRDYAKPKSTDIDLSNPFAFLKLLSPPKPKESKEPKIAVIYAVGAIETGKGGSNPLLGESVGSTTIIEAIRQAENDSTVKAIVLRVDSPGGSALASDLIWNELVRCKKPVVASMGDVAASGGYYISMGCRKIFAEPGTTTGSIGVFGLKLVTGGLTDWAGMKTVSLQRGKNAGIIATDRPYNESERAAMTAIIRDVYEKFIDKALAGRKKAGVEIDRDRLLSLAGGRVWTGRQAKDRGLVDELGTLDDAIAETKKQAGIDPNKTMELLILPKPTSFLDRLMDGDFKSPLGTVGGLDQLLPLPDAAKVIRQIGPILRQRDPVKAMLPYHLELK